MINIEATEIGALLPKLTREELRVIARKNRVPQAKVKRDLVARIIAAKAKIDIVVV